MYEVMSKEYLAENILSMDIKAPRLAKKGYAWAVFNSKIR